MPDPNMSAALRQALAYADPDVVEYHTLELWHDAFSAPLYLVRDYAAIDARIEATAARNAGTVVTFTPCRFDLIPPPQTSARQASATIEIDNTDRIIGTQVQLASRSTTKVTVIYRQYLQDALDDGPEIDPPPAFELVTVTLKAFRIRGELGFRNLQNRAFPAQDFDLSRVPALVP